MYTIYSTWNGRLVYVMTAMSFKGALDEVKKFWADESPWADGRPAPQKPCHEYFKIVNEEGLTMAELVRPPQGEHCSGVVRYPNGVQETFRIQAEELVA